MKNFFEKTINKGNPFVEDKDKKGDENNNMPEETNENNKNLNEKTEESKAAVEEENNSATEEEIETNDSDDNSIEKIKNEYDNLHNQYIRLAADFDNYRKRQQQERESLLKYGATECMKKVIEVVDNFDRAVKSVETMEDIDKMKETFYILNKQLNDSLSKLGLEQIKSVGEKFDPNLHEAVMQTQTDEYEEETIIKELQKGYKLGDKVLRPAMVDVAVK